jgi:hypothetical protein
MLSLMWNLGKRNKDMNKRGTLGRWKEKRGKGEERKRATEGVNMMKMHCTHIQICHNKLLTLYN